jgi:hypothetical protein
MRWLLFKSSLVSCHEAHFAGGKHAFVCLARALAAHGEEVHTFSLGDKASVMMYMTLNGYLGSLSTSRASEGVVSWREGGMTHHVSFRDHPEPSQQLDLLGLSLAGAAARRAAPAHARLLDHARLACPPEQQQQQQLAIIDADESQAGSSERQMSLFEAVVQQFGCRALPLVQNVHFLPFGPSGTSGRSQQLLRAWAQAGPVVCVSRFVQSYLQQHGGAAQLGEQRLWVVPLTAWAAFGDDPAAFPDLGARTARQLSAGALQQPVVGMLKLTPEKGSAVLAGCAAALPELRFLAVSGDPAAQQLQRQLLNVSALGPPPPDPACLAARLPAQTARKVRPGRVCPRLLTPQAPAAGAHHAAPGQHRGRAAAHGRRHRPLPLAGGLRHGGGGGDAAGRAGYCQRRRWASCRPAGAGGRRGKGGGGGLASPAGPAGGRCACRTQARGAPAGRLRGPLLPPPPVASAWVGLLGSWPGSGLRPRPSGRRRSRQRAGRRAPCCDAGALPEAGLGVAPVVPVQPILIPLADGAPCWARRAYLRQDVGGWVQAIQGVLGDAAAYARLSAEGRSRALEFVQRGGQEFERFMAQCVQL